MKGLDGFVSLLCLQLSDLYFAEFYFAGSMVHL